MADQKVSLLTGEPMNPADAVDTTTGTERKISLLTGEPMDSSPGPGVTIGGPAGFTTSAMSTSDYNIRRKDDISKYTSYGVPLGQDLDWDEIRARNQSTAEQWGRGLAKAGVTTLGAVAENTLGIVAGIGSMVMGGSYYDNSVGRAVDNANEWMRENYANYTTEAERNMSSLQKMGTANFWADTVANGIGYSLGSIATMYLTGGMGAFGMLGKVTKLGSLYNASKAVATGAKLANIVGKGAKGARMIKGAQMLDAALLMGLAESSVEARETKKGILEDLKTAYMQENGLDYEWEIPDHDLEDIEKTATAAGNTNFIANLAITTGTNAAMFGKMALGFNAAKKANKDVIWDAISRKAKNKLSDRSRWRKAIDVMKPVAKNGLEEALQEGLQFASNIYSTEYHMSKMHDGGSGDRMKALNKALSGTLGDQEGRESMLVGLLTGMVMGTATTRGQNKARVAAADRLTQTINSGYFDNVRSKVENENLSSVMVQLMDKSLKEGNIKAFKDLQNALITSQGLNAIDQGGYEVMMQKLEDSKSLEDAEFAKMYGYTTELAEGQSFSDISGGESKSQVVENLKKKLENVKKIHKNVNERFPIPEKTKGLPRLLMSEEQRMAEDKVYNNQLALRNELIYKGAKLGDNNRRQKGIIAEMQRLIDEDPVLQDADINIKSEISKIYTPSEDFAFTEEDPDGSKTLEARDKNVKNALDNVLKTARNAGGDISALTALAVDYLGIQGEQRSAINAYNKLSSDPFYQQQFQQELDNAKKIMAERQLDVQVDEAIANSATAEELISNSPSKDLTNKAQKAKLKARYLELQKQQNAARQKFKDNVKGAGTLENQLAALKDLKTDELTPIERAGLADAVRDIQFAIDERDNAENKSNEEKADEMQDAGIDQDPGEAGYMELEELSGVESLSDDGRMLKINGKVYYNHNVNPDDAIERSKSGKIKKVRLVDAEGNRHTFYNTSTNSQADAIAYHIRLAEMVKSEGQPTVNRETALREQRIADKLLAEEMARVSTVGKHGAKTSPSLRQEIYQLERLLEAALRAYDNLKSVYIHEAGATKEDLKNDPELSELAKKLRSLRAQIGARKRVLKARGETVVANNQDIIRAENLARERITKLRQNIAGFTTEEALNDQRLEEIEKELEAMSKLSRAEQLSPEFDEKRRALSEERRVITEINQEIDEKIKNLQAEIKLRQHQLKRFQDELNDPQGAREEAESTTAENAQRQNAAAETADNRARAEKEGALGEGLYVVDRAERSYNVLVGETVYNVTLLGPKTARVLHAGSRQAVSNPEVARKAIATARQFEQSLTSEEENSTATTPNEALETEKEVKTGVTKSSPTPGPAGGIRTGLTKEEMADLGIEIPGMDMPQVDPNQPPTDEFGAARDAAQQKEGATADLNAAQDEKVARQVAVIKKILDESKSVEDAVQKLLEGGHIVSFDGQGLVQIAPGDTAADPSRDAIYFKINGVVIPMYRSSKGTSDKKAGEWYPFFFKSENWVAKGLANNYKEGYGNPELKAIADALNDNVQYSTPKATYKLDPIAGIRAVLPSLSEAEAQALYLGTYGELHSAMVDILQNWNSNIGKLDLSSAVENLKAAKVSNPYGIGGEIQSLEEEYAIFDKAIARLEQMAKPKTEQSSDVEGMTPAVKKAYETLSKDYEESMAQYRDLTSLMEEHNNQLNSLQELIDSLGNSPKDAAIKEAAQILLKELSGNKQEEGISLPNRPAAVPPPRDPEPKASPTNSTLGVKMANSNREIGVESVTDPSGQERYVIGVDENGRRSTNYPTLNGESLIPNTNLLIHSPVGTEVEFEIIKDSWFTSTYGENANPNDYAYDVPIYVKIGDQIVGKLEASDSADRTDIVQKLSSGERVISKIASKRVGVGGQNHTRVTTGESPEVYFSNPSEVFSEPLEEPLKLAAVSKALGGSSWVTGDAGLDARIGATRDESNFYNMASGQIGFVVQEQDSGDGTVKVIPASTANLVPAAQDVALEAIKNKDYKTAAEIVANSKADDSVLSDTYLHFGEFEDKTKYLIYRSPGTGELVRINEHNMAEALNKKTPKYTFVKFDPTDKTFKNLNKNELYVDMQEAGGVAEDFKEFLKDKKYQVNPASANSAAGYTSPVTGLKYNNYQNYLFSRAETGDIEGRQGHSSIVATDLVNVNGSIFNSPRVEFEKGNIVGADNKTETQTAASSTPPATGGGIRNLSADEIADLLGDDFLSDFSKEDLEDNCGIEGPDVDPPF
jgi:hypothetical protein